MNSAIRSRISLLLIATLVAELWLGPVRAAQNPRPQRPELPLNTDLRLTRVAAPTTSSASTTPTKTTAKNQTPPDKQSAGTTSRYQATLTPKKTAVQQPLRAGLQFLYASFTNYQEPQQQTSRSVAGVPVKFSLDSLELGTLSAPGVTANPDGSIEVLTNSEGVAEVLFTAGSKRNKGKLTALAENAFEKATDTVTIEVVRPSPTKWLLLLGLAALITGVVVVVTKDKDKIKPLPPPTIP